MNAVFTFGQLLQIIGYFLFCHTGCHQSVCIVLTVEVYAVTNLKSRLKITETILTRKIKIYQFRPKYVVRGLKKLLN